MKLFQGHRSAIGIAVVLTVALSCLTWAAFSDDPARIGEVVQSYLKLVEQRSAKPLDFPKIKELYAALSPLFLEAEAILPGLRQEADGYLARAEKAPVKLPLLQGVEKSAQRAFVALMERSLNKVKTQSNNTAAALASLKAAKALYGGIENTALRRGDYVGSQRLFQDRVLFAFTYLEDAVKAKNTKNIDAGIAEILGVVDKVYFLSVLYEIDGIGANRGKNEDVVAEKVVEGTVFFKIIKASAKNAQAVAAFEAELAKPPAEMNLQALKEYLKIAYPDLAAEFKAKM